MRGARLRLGPPPPPPPDRCRAGRRTRLGARLRATPPPMVGALLAAALVGCLLGGLLPAAAEDGAKGKDRHGDRHGAEVKDRDFWYEEARAALRQRLSLAGQTRPAPRAKNVILMVGDGMGVSTVTASRILRGQRQGRPGEEATLAWDRFPTVGLAKTYNADAQVGESSACATALMCGVKANFETVGLDARARFENCGSTYASRVPSLLSWAQQEGKATGVVTNTRLTHATPAALFAHAASRYWEDDGKVPSSSRRVCKDIARQLVEDEPGRSVNVLLGGGRRHFLPKVARDPEAPHEEGRRLDGRNMVDDWVRDKKKRGLHAQYVWTKAQLQAAAATAAPSTADNIADPQALPPNVPQPVSTSSQRPDYILGLFAYSHMDFEADRDAGPDGDPSLADMTRAALAVLMRNPRGFFLFVEGGRIDHAHHYNNAYRALDETLALESALLAAMELVDVTETLIVLTADHSHVLTLGGLATPRGNPILGVDSKVSDVDGMPYSTLLYGNGPGYSVPRTVPANLTAGTPHAAPGTTAAAEEDEEARNRVHGAAVPRQWATHGGEDVPVYSQGPLAGALLGGVMDQTFLPHAIAYIACLAEFADRCKGGADNYTAPPMPQMCVAPEVSSISSGAGSAGHSPEVVASSVMADHGKTMHSSGSNGGPARLQLQRHLRLRLAATLLAAGSAYALGASTLGAAAPGRGCSAAAALAAVLAATAVGVT